MKRLWNLLAQDLLLIYRSGHVLITLILLAITLLLITFLPRSVDSRLEIVLDTSPGKVVEQALRARGLPADAFYDDRAAFDAALEQNPMKVGVVFSGGLEVPRFEIITSTAVAEENINLLRANLEGLLAEMQGLPEPSGVAVTYLRERTAPPPFNLRFVPVILIFEVVLLGFFIVAVMVFQEKAEGTLRAYRVTPAGALPYILSKVLLFAALSIVYGVIPVLYGFGLGVDYLALLALLALSSALMTLFSLLVAAFYRDLTEWFFVGVAILLVNALPMLSYALPAFAPRWLTLLPSYAGVFAARDVLFAGAGLERIAPTLLYLLGLCLAAFAACYLVVRAQIMRGQRA